MVTLGCCRQCSGEAVLKGPGATHHFTLSFCHPNELPGREGGGLCSAGVGTQSTWYPWCQGDEEERAERFERDFSF